MKEIPIIFSTPMVQAILEGRKTLTRRVIKPQPPEWIEQFGYTCFTPAGHISGRGCYEGRSAEKFIKCPYGQPGDRLFVKETWKVDSVDDRRKRMLIDFKAIQSGYSGAEVEVKFTPERYYKFRKFYQKNGWQSPYFMPKEAARLWLNNEGVRVERLQEITEEDAKAEGSQLLSHDGKTIYTPNYRAAFRVLWDSINAKRGHGWDQNNWLWVVSFKRTN